MKGLHRKRVLFLLMSVLLILSSCGGMNTREIEAYPPQSDLERLLQGRYVLTDVVKSVTNSNDISKIYSAGTTSIAQVTSFIEQEFPPTQKGERQENKQVFIYPNHFLIFTQDNESPSNTLIEYSSYGFVRDNFSPSFFEGMLLMAVLDDLLDVDDWHKTRKRRCMNEREYGECYQGYVRSSGWYKGKGLTTPNLRGSSVRGGGPNSGK